MDSCRYYCYSSNIKCWCQGSFLNITTIAVIQKPSKKCHYCYSSDIFNGLLWERKFYWPRTSHRAIGHSIFSLCIHVFIIQIHVFSIFILQLISYNLYFDNIYRYIQLLFFFHLIGTTQDTQFVIWTFKCNTAIAVIFKLKMWCRRSVLL